MKSTLILIFLFMFTSIPIYSIDNDKDNGGGGINKNGRYMTFYSAGLYVVPKEESALFVPSLKETIDLIKNIPALSKQRKAHYLNALIQTQNREYFKVDQEYFSEEIRKRLISEYVRVTGASKENLVLFAITDTNSNRTYLFPEFYTLNETEQMTILFHESYWIVNAVTAQYASIIEAEMTMQAYIENPEDTKNLLQLLKTIGTEKDILSYAIITDKNSYNLTRLLLGGLLSGGIFSDHYIKVIELIGPNLHECYLGSREEEFKTRCLSLWMNRIYELKQQYPNSMFINLIENFNITYALYFSYTYQTKERKIFIDNSRILFKLEEYTSCMDIIFDYEYNTSNGLWFYDTLGSKKKNIFCLKK